MKGIFQLLTVLLHLAFTSGERGSNCPMNPGDCPYLTDSQGQCDIDNDCPAGYKCTYQCSQGGTPSPAPYATSPPYLPVSDCPFDLLILFDNSEVFPGLKPINVTRGMVYRILNKFPVSENGTHVALGLVSEEPSVLLHFNGLDPLPQSNSRIRDTLQLVRVKVKAQLNRLDLALEMAYRMFQRKNGAREHARKVLLIITDGKMPIMSHIPPIYEVSYPLIDMGVYIVTIGFGNDIDIGNLLEIGSDPKNVYKGVPPELLARMKAYEQSECPKKRDITDTGLHTSP